ncbi:MAG TPA: stage II sporulation protein M [Gemmatimonadales bacterium]|jgi:uncharacterized membrane protein SpoIIM required for sporulation/uncharacterized RDD family membrane protein YckC
MERVRVAATSLGRRIAIETPENVLLEFELAGVGSRFAAAFADIVILGILYLAIFAAFALLLGGIRLETWSAAVMVLVAFVLFWGYFALFEALWQGQTPGKHSVGLRVVMDTGHPLTFGAALARNLLRAVDSQPGLLYFVGALFVFLHPHHKRLGDIVAGTIVVRDRPTEQRLSVPVIAVPEAGEGPIVTAEVPELTDEEFRLVEQFLARREQFEAAARQRVAYALLQRLADRLPAGARGVEGRLEALYAVERRRRGGAVSTGRAARGIAATATARFIARKQQSWEAFRADAMGLERRGLKTLPGDQLTTFAARYREAAADLARARTYGVDARVVAYLERAVSAGHNALYGLRGVGRVGLGRLLAHDLTAALWRSRGYIAVAFLLTAAPAVAGYQLLRSAPSRAAELLPDEMIARAEGGREAVLAGVGYAQAPSLYLPLMASNIIANNVQVAIGAFAFGITAGIGTVWLLFFNGLFLGAVVGLFRNYGLAGWLLTFIAGHGILELTAIFVAGAAGLRIGRALVAPGDAPRRDALVVAGRESVLLVIAAACLLLLAGTIEGLLSASDAPVPVKLGVSATTVVLLVLLGISGRAAARGTAPQ